MTKHAEELTKLGWQYFECPACGSEGARAFPKPEQEPVAVTRFTFTKPIQFGPPLGIVMKLEGDETCKLYPFKDEFDDTNIPVPTAQPSVSVEQEPVVWMYVNKSTHEVSFQKHMRGFVDHGAFAEVPLFSEPLANQEKTSGSPVKDLNCICGAVWQGEELVHVPPQRKPLTRKEVLDIIDKHPAEKKTLLPMFYRDQAVDIARAIEAAHGI